MSASLSSPVPASVIAPALPIAPIPPALVAPSGGSQFAARLLTAVIVVGPGVALGVLIPLLWGDIVNLRDILVAVVLYVITGHGIAVGFHRLFAHRSFRPNRAVKLALAGAGSMAIEGSVIGWVAAHRRHHRFSDHAGDPHSPHGFGTGLRAQLRGLAHAHVGWLFSADATSEEKYAPDLIADPDLVKMSRLWPVFAIGSLVLPFAVGWLLSGTVMGGLTTFLWAGVVRMVLLHHVTWSVNSICHVYGPRPFRTKDQSTNVALLSVLSMGESFHNLHHAYPTSARHGVGRHQIDSSAGVIRLLERAGWVTDVKWPTPARVASLLNEPGPEG